MDEMRVLRADDPGRAELEAAGWTLAGESWGARLTVAAPPRLLEARAAVEAARAAGFEVRELREVEADAVNELEAATQADYPYTPATAREHLDLDAARTLFAGDGRVFGAFDDGLLVAVTAIERRGGHAETDFTSVRSTHRRRGLAVAVKALSIVTLADEGVRTFGTGGAQANAGSIRMNEALGYEIHERWVSLRRAAAGGGSTEPAGI